MVFKIYLQIYKRGFYDCRSNLTLHKRRKIILQDWEDRGRFHVCGGAVIFTRRIIFLQMYLDLELCLVTLSASLRRIAQLAVER